MAASTAHRALAWDGLFPIELPEPAALAQLADEIRCGRPRGLDDFDLVVEVEPGRDFGPWHQAGATWVLTQFGTQPHAHEVHDAIKAGPR